MDEFIICLTKYTAIFICILYAYTRLLRIKLKVWDLFDIPLFIALSAVLYFVTVYIKILVPIGFLIFGIAFLFLRFRKTFYETATVCIISLGISVVLLVLAIILGFLVAVAFHFIKNESLKIILAQFSVSIIQIVSIFILFKVKRLQSGVNPKGENATFDILLYISVICIFTMMLLYAEDIKQYMLKVVILIIALCGLLIIVWWRRHITYNYREAVKRRDFNRMEDEVEEVKLNSAENDLQLAVYNRHFHYLNKVLPDCALLAESAAAQTGCADACAVRDIMQNILHAMKLVNEKCSFQNVPKTGIREIDAPVIRLYTEAENKKLNASAEIFADVENWFKDNKLRKGDIHTLLAYLIDNAINSALGLPNAKVRVEFGEADGNPFIRIYDSGEQFDEGVIAKLGKEQITTRAGVGGSGIGLFDSFEILAKYGASFTIDEVTQSFNFTKVIEIAFDGRHSFTVRTCRESVVAACAKRRDITVERVEILRDGTNG